MIYLNRIPPHGVEMFNVETGVHFCVRAEDWNRIVEEVVDRVVEEYWDPEKFDHEMLYGRRS